MRFTIDTLALRLDEITRYGLALGQDPLAGVAQRHCRTETSGGRGVRSRRFRKSRRVSHTQDQLEGNRRAFKRFTRAFPLTAPQMRDAA